MAGQGCIWLDRCLADMRHVHISRLPAYDYRSDGWYFVTINSRLRLPIFAGHEELVTGIFRSVAKDVTGVIVDTIKVMPDHVHCLLKLEGSALALGEIIRRMKVKVSYVLNQTCWQSNYYEHVVRSDEALYLIREYIRRNEELTELKKKSRIGRSP